MSSRRRPGPAGRARPASRAVVPVRTILAALPSCLALAVGPAGPAQAHHGWQEFETGRPFYLNGTVTDVRWGNPHPEVRLDLPATIDLPADLASRAIPAELEELGGRDVLRRTRALEGGRQVTLVLAPPSRLEAWGMADRTRVGEHLRAVGYLARDGGAEFRPELLIREDGRAIRQRSVPLPAPDTAGGSDADGAGGSPDGADTADNGAPGGFPAGWPLLVLIVGIIPAAIGVHLLWRRHAARNR